ncbi:MAG: DUF4183 domain-containing protein [Niallia sp.]
MPLQIMKLAVSASLSIDTAPTVDRFFYIVTEPITGEGTITIPADDFMTDTGADGATLPELTADNSYLNVYVNGVLQMDDLIAYTPGGTDVGQLIITVPGDSSVIADTPVVLEITNFAPTSETTITT